MSRSYEMHVTITEYSKVADSAIVQAACQQWPFEDPDVDLGDGGLP